MNSLKQSISSKGIGVVIFLLVISVATWASAYERRSSNENSVRVNVVPVQLSSGQAAKFEIQMNTHSVALNHDMVAVSVLKDDQGREYRPLDWQGSPPGGHHRSGLLEFPAISKDTKSITLYIKNIADIPERRFAWKLEQ